MEFFTNKKVRKNIEVRWVFCATIVAGESNMQNMIIEFQYFDSHVLAQNLLGQLIISYSGFHTPVSQGCAGHLYQ